MLPISNLKVLSAMNLVPRHRFVPDSLHSQAYADRPLPIGEGQTISQPYVVALMVQELGARPEHRVLDIGAGSGYQTAILTRLVRYVYAVERISILTERAINALADMNVSNASICTEDGTMGWPEEAPFDRIICGASAPEVPQPWIDQLADGGRIVLPIGDKDDQILTAVEKHDRRISHRAICRVRFVKLIGCHGWPIA